MADRRGRKPAMILSFAIMGIAMTGLALTPSYATAGMAAPILAILFRLLQGFALGGEVGPNIAYLMEAAPPGRRGFFISLNFASADFAVLCGVGRVRPLLDPHEAPSARDLGLEGRVPARGGDRAVRSCACERRSSKPAAEDETMRRSGKTALLSCGAGMIIIAGATIGNYTLDYLTTYAQATLDMAVRRHSPPPSYSAWLEWSATSLEVGLPIGSVPSGCWSFLAGSDRIGDAGLSPAERACGRRGATSRPPPFSRSSTSWAHLRQRSIS